MQSECEEAMSERGSLQRLHQPSLSRKMRRSITKVKRSIQRMTGEYTYNTYTRTRTYYAEMQSSRGINR